VASDIQYNDEDETTKIMQEILESSKEGLTTQDMLDGSGLSYQYLREISAELADKKWSTCPLGKILGHSNRTKTKRR
jgi:predicted transcriptional regulator